MAQMSENIGLPVVMSLGLQMHHAFAMAVLFSIRMAIAWERMSGWHLWLI